MSALALLASGLFYAGALASPVQESFDLSFRPDPAVRVSYTGSLTYWPNYMTPEERASLPEILRITGPQSFSGPLKMVSTFKRDGTGLSVTTVTDLSLEAGGQTILNLKSTFRANLDQQGTPTQFGKTEVELTPKPPTPIPEADFASMFLGGWLPPTSPLTPGKPLVKEVNGFGKAASRKFTLRYEVVAEDALPIIRFVLPDDKPDEKLTKAEILAHEAQQDKIEPWIRVPRVKVKFRFEEADTKSVNSGVAYLRRSDGVILKMYSRQSFPDNDGALIEQVTFLEDPAK